MNYHRIVVEDPTGEYWEGAVVLPRHEHVIAERGGCTLPCLPEDFAAAPFASFAKRAWGSGWDVPPHTPQQFAPIAIYKTRNGTNAIHWAARIVPTPAAKAAVEQGAKLDGTIRIASTPIRGNLHAAALSELPGRQQMAVALNALGPLDEDGGWTVHGEGAISSAAEGLYGLCLYGFGPGVRVAWLAVSLTP